MLFLLAYHVRVSHPSLLYFEADDSANDLQPHHRRAGE